MKNPIKYLLGAASIALLVSGSSLQASDTEGLSNGLDKVETLIDGQENTKAQSELNALYKKYQNADFFSIFEDRYNNLKALAQKNPQDLTQKVTNGLNRVEELLKNGQADTASDLLKSIQNLYGTSEAFFAASDRYAALKKVIADQKNPIGRIGFNIITISVSDPGKYPDLKKKSIGFVYLDIDYSKPFGEALEESFAQFRKDNPNKKFDEIIKPDDKVKFRYVIFDSCGDDFKYIRSIDPLTKTLFELQDGKKGSTSRCSTSMASVRIE